LDVQIYVTIKPFSEEIEKMEVVASLSKIQL